MAQQLVLVWKAEMGVRVQTALRLKAQVTKPS